MLEIPRQVLEIPRQVLEIPRQVLEIPRVIHRKTVRKTLILTINLILLEFQNN